MVRNSILIFCLCVCQCHISVSLYLYTHIINKLLHGWLVCTIFIIHSLWRIAKLTRSLRSLVRLTILHNSYALTNHEVISIYCTLISKWSQKLFSLWYHVAILSVKNAINLSVIDVRKNGDHLFSSHALLILYSRRILLICDPVSNIWHYVITKGRKWLVSKLFHGQKPAIWDNVNNMIATNTISFPSNPLKQDLFIIWRTYSSA